MKKPTIKECFEYSNNMEQSTLFFHYFESQDWMIGKRGNAKPMSNWKSALTGWIKRSKPKKNNVEIAVANTSTKLIDLLWVRMTEIYGHKWVSSYGTTPSKPWTEVINNLTPENIKHGLTQILKNGESWPPSLTEFNKMCRSYRKPIKSLSHLPGRKETLIIREKTKALRLESMAKINGVLA